MRTVLLTMSLAGTLSLLCCVLFFRLFGKSLKAKWRRVLLLLAMTFFLFPLPQYNRIMLQGGRLLHLIPDTKTVSSDAWLPINGPYTIFMDETGRSSYSQSLTIINVMTCVLLAVSAVILLYHIVNDILVRKALRIRSQPAGAEETALLKEMSVCMGIGRRIRLAQAEQVSVPVVSGVFSPTILLPKGIRADNRALRSMLLHELGHIKHQDILLQWAGLLVVALHWYNPFSYLLFHLLSEVNEQYSDAKAVQKLSEQGKRCYCEDLINYSEQAGMGGPSLVVLGFTKNAKKQIKGRIDEVLNKKRKRSGIAFCAGVLILLMGTATAFIYRPPLVISGSLPSNINEEKILEQEVDVYFIGCPTDSEIPAPHLSQPKQEE